jgi:hypothetical protein
MEVREGNDFLILSYKSDEFAMVPSFWSTEVEMWHNLGHKPDEFIGLEGCSDEQYLAVLAAIEADYDLEGNFFIRVPKKAITQG